MTETARALNTKEVIELIRSHIATRLDGGPNRKAEDIELGRMAGLDTEPISALWDEAERQMVKVDLPPLEVVVLPPQEAAEQPSASTVAMEAKDAIGPSGSIPAREDEGWGKRRSLGEPSKADEASLFLKPTQPEVEAPEATPEPEEEPKPQPNESSDQGRVMLPAVVKTSTPAWDWDDAITAMNEQHAIIDNVGGKTAIACWEPSSLDPSKLVVVFQTKESFMLRYSNRYARIDVADGKGGSQQRLMPLGQWWLGHRQRRQYRGVTFLPAGPKEVNQCLNLWQGWGVEPKAGDWLLIREHIEVVLGSSNAEYADYIIRWIAWAIQNPGGTG
jgi:hypothetical protein